MNWDAFLSTFALVFVAELGDKTQLAVFTQSCKYRSPWSVFLGGSAALIAVTALGVGGGHLLGHIVPAMAIRILSTAAFLIMGVLLWREATASTGDKANEATCPLDNGEKRTWDWRAFGSPLTLIVVAELGDKTQLTVMGLSCRHSTPLAVFVGGATALTAVTALGVIGGRQLSRLLPERTLLKIAAVMFVIVGILMGVEAI